MATRVDQGSKEYLLYRVTDATGVITDLSGATPKFDVKVQDTALAEALGTAKITAQNCVVGSDKMLLQCLVDSTAGLGTTPWPKGLYYLWVYWTIGAEVPREGPFELYVI
jgi:hypothetical protein